MIDFDALDRIVGEHLTEDTDTYLAERGYDARAVGRICSQLAIGTLASRGHDAGSDELKQWGPELTRVAVVAFETALRVEEEREGTARSAVTNLLDDVETAQAEDLTHHALEQRIGAMFLGFGGGFNHEDDLRAAVGRETKR